MHTLKYLIWRSFCFVGPESVSALRPLPSLLRVCCLTSPSILLLLCLCCWLRWHSTNAKPAWFSACCAVFLTPPLPLNLCAAIVVASAICHATPGLIDPSLSSLSSPFFAPFSLCLKCIPLHPLDASTALWSTRASNIDATIDTYRSAHPHAPHTLHVAPPPPPPSSPRLSTRTAPLPPHRSRISSPLSRVTRTLSALTHVDGEGNARMVDVGTKRPQRRTAIARARVCVSDAVARVLTEESGVVAKGNVLQVAQLAGICGAKHTATLIPLCHNIPLDSVDVHAALAKGGREIVVVARARTTGVTGVEMEAMTAASVAALTVYDMLKALDKGIVLADTRLLLKSGGKSGLYVASAASTHRATTSDDTHTNRGEHEHEHNGGGAGERALQLGIPPEVPLAWVEDVLAER